MSFGVMAISILSFTFRRLSWKGNIQFWMLLLSLNSIRTGECLIAREPCTIPGKGTAGVRVILGKPTPRINFCFNLRGEDHTVCENMFGGRCDDQMTYCCADLTQYCGGYVSESGELAYDSVLQPNGTLGAFNSYHKCKSDAVCYQKAGFGVCRRRVCCTNLAATQGHVCPNGELARKPCLHENNCKKNQWCVSVIHPQTKGETKGCCPIQYCPVTNLAPAESSRHVELPTCKRASSECGNGRYCAKMPIFTASVHNQSSEYLCCPIPYSKFYNSLNISVYSTETGKIEGNITEPGKVCTTHDDCSNEEFCDDAIASNQILNHSFCYPKPICAGKTILQDKVGILNCTADEDCGKDAFCDKFLTLNTSSIGVCCQAKCPLSSIPDTENSSINAYVSDRCSSDHQCAEADKRDVHRGHCVELSSNLPKKNKMCCAYQRTSAICNDTVGEIPLRNNLTFDYLHCDVDSDCQEESYYCAAGYCCTIKPEEGIEVAKCADDWTVIRTENECTNDESCYGEVNGTASCEESEEDGIYKKRCCPIYNAANGLDFDSQGYYCTQVNCTDSFDCGGRSRFCSNDSKCCYFGDGIIAGIPYINYPHSSMCSKSYPCPIEDGESICVYMGNDTDTDGNCYYNPIPQPQSTKKEAVANELYIKLIIGLSACTLLFATVALYSMHKYNKNETNKNQPTEKSPNTTSDENIKTTQAVTP